MTKNRPYLLAIESAVAGGSVALFIGNEFVSGKSGAQAISRAEDLVPNVNDLLKEANVPKSDLVRIAVSLGPGSYTGLRIGLASVMGLARGLDIEYIGVPLFEALASCFPHTVAFALPMGKTDICFTLAGETGKPSVATSSALVENSQFAAATPIGVHSDLMLSLGELGALNLIDIGRNLAQYVGTASLNRPASRNLEAIYVQNPRFG